MKLPNFFKNKYFIALSVFGIYTLFLDDVDVFVIVRQNIKLSKIEQQKEKTKQLLVETKEIQKKLHTLDGIEKYAREKKLFKQDNEDIFVISYE
ncbi:MAG: hypothetical protein M9916_04750 [Crocinitomicaceae bacterium]|nr:hypothetical protein [Crocinitomicaceae bacterium]